MVHSTHTLLFLHNWPEWQEVYMYVDQSLETLQEASFVFRPLFEQSTPLLFSLPILCRASAGDKGSRCRHTSPRFSSSLFCARGCPLPIGWLLTQSLHPPEQVTQSYSESWGNGLALLQCWRSCIISYIFYLLTEDTLNFVKCSKCLDMSVARTRSMMELRRVRYADLSRG